MVCGVVEMLGHLLDLCLGLCLPTRALGRLVILDTELGGILVLTCSIDDDLEAVVCLVIFEGGGRCPCVLAGVGGRVYNALEFLGIG